MIGCYMYTSMFTRWKHGFKKIVNKVSKNGQRVYCYYYCVNLHVFLDKITLKVYSDFPWVASAK